MAEELAELTSAVVEGLVEETSVVAEELVEACPTEDVCSVVWCWSRPLRRSESQGRDSMVSDLMLQHGPEWTTKVQ